MLSLAFHRPWLRPRQFLLLLMLPPGSVCGVSMVYKETLYDGGLTDDHRHPTYLGTAIST